MDWRPETFNVTDEEGVLDVKIRTDWTYFYSQIHQIRTDFRVFIFQIPQIRTETGALQLEKG